MSRRLLAIALCATVLVASACGASSQPTESTTTIASAVTVQWLPCGAIECAQVEVPVDYAVPNGSKVSIGIFRRVATAKKSSRTLFFMPDRHYGDSARVLVERAPLTMGADIASFTVVGIAPRGSVDSPMPAGNEHLVSTLASSDDVDAVRRALSLGNVSVMAWGAGATTASVMKMLNPDVVDVMVLDSPSDPAVSQTMLVDKQIESSEAAVVGAMHWCASHISCPMNANVAKELNKFKTALRIGRIAGGADYSTIARAGTAALSAGVPQELFVAISSASAGDSQSLLGLGGAAPSVASAYAPCADVSKKAAARIAQMYAANMDSHTRLIHIGAEASVYAFCNDLPEANLQLGKIDAVKSAFESNVMVTISRGDPVVPPYAARTMAKRMGWTFQSVYVNRHLVVGIDRAITAQALQFLMKS